MVKRANREVGAERERSTRDIFARLPLTRQLRGFVRDIFFFPFFLSLFLSSFLFRRQLDPNLDAREDNWREKLDKLQNPCFLFFFPVLGVYT